jgi:hypothetical protein
MSLTVTRYQSTKRKTVLEAALGKRGPTAKGEFGDKSAVLSTRISADLRAALEQAVKDSGLTLSREIERRLRRTFSDDEKIAEGFGNRRNLTLMKMVAMLMHGVRPDRIEADWLDDPWLFEQVIIRMNALFNALRPPGPIEPPANYYGSPKLDTPEMHKVASEQKALMLVGQLQAADASLPLESGRRGRANLMKADLGDVINRPKIFHGTAEDHRSEVTRLRAEEEMTSGKSPRSKGKAKK